MAAVQVGYFSYHFSASGPDCFVPWTGFLAPSSKVDWREKIPLFRILE